MTAADSICSVVPAGAELRDVELFGGSTAGAPILASCAPHTQYSPRERPTKYVCFRCIVGKSRHRAHTESQREESGESQFQGSLWRATLSREAWMPIWGLSTESMKPWPPPGDG